jgi:uncharacterized protein
VTSAGANVELNVELVQGAYAAFNRGDRSALLETLDPDVEWLPMRAMVEGGGYRGREAVAELFNQDGVLQDLDVEPEDLAPLGDDRVLARVRLRGRGRGSGVEVDQRLADLWTIRDGLVTRFEVFSSPVDARRAAARRGL